MNPIRSRFLSARSSIYAWASNSTKLSIHALILKSHPSPRKILSLLNTRRGGRLIHFSPNYFFDMIWSQQHPRPEWLDSELNNGTTHFPTETALSLKIVYLHRIISWCLTSQSVASSFNQNYSGYKPKVQMLKTRQKYSELRRKWKSRASTIFWKAFDWHLKLSFGRDPTNDHVNKAMKVLWVPSLIRFSWRDISSSSLSSASVWSFYSFIYSSSTLEIHKKYFVICVLCLS